jgi:hypothetical protein
MPPIAIFKDRAFLISPLEAPVYILELPSKTNGSLPKEAILEGEIRHQLKALYPGTPENTVVDYKIYRSGKRNTARTAAVFVISRPCRETYLNLKRPLIPGISLMSAGMHRCGEKAGVSILCTPQWIEAAFFENAVVRRYASCPMEKEGLPLTLIAPFPDGPDPVPVLLINAGLNEEQKEKTETALHRSFNRVLYTGINGIKLKGKLKNAGIFNDTKNPSPIRRRGSIKVLAVLNCIVLLLSLRIIAAEKNRELYRLKNYCHEQDKRQNEAKRLEREITELVSRQTRGVRNKQLDPYRIISQIQACLFNAWIKSLVLQEGNFNLEAEGADSIVVLQSLQASGHFSALTLHQASPSKYSGEQFTISGRVNSYEK